MHIDTDYMNAWHLQPPESPFLEASPEEFRYEAYKESQATGSCTEYAVTELRMRAQALRLRNDIVQFLSEHEVSALRLLDSSSFTDANYWA